MRTSTYVLYPYVQGCVSSTAKECWKRCPANKANGRCCANNTLAGIVWCWAAPPKAYSTVRYSWISMLVFNIS